MIVKEREMRTPKLNLLICKMQLTEDNSLMFELKSGKRTECISLETLVRVINEFAGHMSLLYVTKR